MTADMMKSGMTAGMLKSHVSGQVSDINRLLLGWLEGEISFLAQGFSIPLSQAINHTVICFLGENFAAVHDLRSTGEDPEINYCKTAGWIPFSGLHPSNSRELMSNI
ncbi:hypothetical protein BsWGS_27602 [Bradybaena similaris]